MNGGRQCMGSVGMKNGGEYSTGVKLNVVGVETGSMGMKGGHGCVIPMYMGRKWVAGQQGRQV